VIRDRTFFFGSYETQEVRARSEMHFAVPTVSQRGIFGSGASGLDGVQPTLFRPDTAAYPVTLAGNGIFSLFPFPNDPLGPYGQNTFTQTLPRDAAAQIVSLKLDHRHRGTTFAGRYSVSDEDSIVPAVGNALFAAVKPRARVQNVVVTAVGNLGPSVTNALRFSFGRTAIRFDEVRDSYLTAPTRFRGEAFLLNRPLLLNLTTVNDNMAHYVGGDSAAAAAFWQGVSMEPVGAADAINGPMGQVNIAGFSPVGLDTFRFPQRRLQHTFQIAETATWIHGTRALTLGVDAQRLELKGSLKSGIRPMAEFNMVRPLPQEAFARPVCGIFGCEPQQAPQPTPPDIFTGATMAAAGVPAAVFQTLNFNSDYSTRGSRWQTDVFVQWDFRLKPNIQLSMGGRLDFNHRPKSFSEGAMAAYNYSLLTDHAIAAQRSPSCDSRCQAFINGLKQAFPADFKETFGKDRLGSDARLGFAWNPLSLPRTVFRGGFGVYTGTFPMIVITETRSLFPEFIPLNVVNVPGEIGRSPFSSEGPFPKLLKPGTINVLNPGLASINPVSFLAEQLGFLRPTLFFTRSAPHLDNPYGYQYGLTVEQDLSGVISLSASYTGTQGRKLLRVTTPVGGPLRSKLDYDGISAGAGGLPAPNWAVYLPQEEVSIAPTTIPIPMVQFEGTATSSYNSLQLGAHKNYGRGLVGDLAFTWSHAIDDVSDFFDLAGAYALPQDSFRRSERASANFDAPFRVAGHLVWDLPFLRANHRYIGGWQISTIFVMQSGQRFTVNSGVDSNLDGNLTDRPMVGGIAANRSGDRRTSIVLSSQPPSLLAPIGQNGTLGRNTFVADRLKSWDLAVTKLVTSEPFRVTLRGEMFNASNRAHFAIPVRILEFPSFGKAVSTVSSPRTVQLSLKVSF